MPWDFLFSASEDNGRLPCLGESFWIDRGGGFRPGWCAGVFERLLRGGEDEKPSSLQGVFWCQAGVALVIRWFVGLPKGFFAFPGFGNWWIFDLGTFWPFGGIMFLYFSRLLAGKSLWVYCTGHFLRKPLMCFTTVGGFVWRCLEKLGFFLQRFLWGLVRCVIGGYSPVGGDSNICSDGPFESLFGVGVSTKENSEESLGIRNPAAQPFCQTSMKHHNSSSPKDFLRPTGVFLKQNEEVPQKASCEDVWRCRVLRCWVSREEDEESHHPASYTRL